MILKFSKYQGTGNDFIMIDRRNIKLKNDAIDISGLCNRKFGIGADGLIFIDTDNDSDFRMTYFNSDGNEADMCANGARCAVAFYLSGYPEKDQAIFKSRNYTHTAKLIENRNNNCSNIKISLCDPQIDLIAEKYSLINTGVPHYVEFTDKVDSDEFVDLARIIRNDNRFAPEGVNVNFAKIENNTIYLRSYERGVEDETLSCGTGVAATAIAASLKGHNKQPFIIKARGGELKIEFSINEGMVSNLFLQGPACRVFDGEIRI
jgi:diaminopimelate epimerase